VKEHIQVIAMERLGWEEEERGEWIAPQFSVDSIDSNPSQQVIKVADQLTRLTLLITLACCLVRVSLLSFSSLPFNCCPLLF
jgi:hypothetical protein